LKKRCAGQIGSLLELLQGRLSDNVMSVVTDRQKGLFPLPGEISLECSCPDWASMCKHAAAVLYGVGARLDEEPELLFLLRGVDHEELIDTEVGVAAAAGRKGGRRRIADHDLADVFGIEMSQGVKQSTPEPSPRRKKAPAKPRKTSKRAAKRSSTPRAKAAGKKTRARKKTSRPKPTP
jgi:uncharacterized Zn finger protein